jgi:ketopantoate reductase
MLQDLQNNKGTEIREINGHMITKSEKLGMDPVVNRELMRQVMRLETVVC